LSRLFILLTFGSAKTSSFSLSLSLLLPNKGVAGGVASFLLLLRLIALARSESCVCAFRFVVEVDVVGEDRALVEPVVRGVEVEEAVAGEGRAGLDAFAGIGRALGFVTMC